MHEKGESPEESLRIKTKPAQVGRDNIQLNNPKIHTGGITYEKQMDYCTRL